MLYSATDSGIVITINAGAIANLISIAFYKPPSLSVEDKISITPLLKYVLIQFVNSMTLYHCKINKKC